MLRRNRDLIEIVGFRINGDEADHFAVGFRDDDVGRCRQLVAPAIAPPVEPLLQNRSADRRSASCAARAQRPRVHLRSQAAAKPQRAESECRRFVHASLLRQFQLDAAVAAVRLVGRARIDRLELTEAGGDQTLRRARPWRSDIAPQRSRAPPTGPSWSCMSMCRTSGRMSVWPSTRSTQLISDGICFSRSISALASLSSSARPSGRRTA